MNAPAAFFQIDQHRTSYSREILAGLTTFATMSYIVVVNPAILSAAGIPRGPSFVATVAVAVFGCLLMGVYANRPFAIAPYMGENAFIAFTVCNQLVFKWQTALAAVFIAGVIFVAITALRKRSRLPSTFGASTGGKRPKFTFIGWNERLPGSSSETMCPRVMWLSSAPKAVVIGGAEAC